MIEAIHDHFVVRYDDNRGLLVDRDSTQQVHDNAGPCSIERSRRLVRKGRLMLLSR
jgi:hypothetical protein